MAIVRSSVLSIAFGFIIVTLTSPTAHSVGQSPSTSLLTLHALFVDIVLAILIGFTILYRIEPSWVAKNGSFPYTSQPKWIFGHRAFDFQLLVFEIFHIEWLSRAVHAVNITTEGFLWLLVVHITFGFWGTGLTLALLSLQAVSYGDPVLAIAIIGINTLFGAASYSVLQISSLNPLLLLNAAKISLFWMVIARTVNHAFEPLPPMYHPSVAAFDDNFGYPGYTLCFTDPLRSVWLMGLGIVSEFGAGIPGRFFNTIIFKLLWKTGYRSQALLDVADAKKQAWIVIEGGWQAHPATAVLFEWATHDRKDEPMRAGMRLSL